MLKCVWVMFLYSACMGEGLLYCMWVRVCFSVCGYVGEEFS